MMVVNPYRFGSSVTLNALSLDNLSIDDAAPEDTVVGNVINTTGGSTLSLTDDAGGRFKLVSGVIKAGATATDYATATTHNITIRETLAGATNTPRDSVITIAVAGEVAGPLPTFVSAGAVSGGSAGSNPGNPAGSVTGDLWLLFVHTDNETCPTPTGPSDWALVTTPTGVGAAGGATSARLTVWWRRCAASNPATSIADSGSVTLGRIAAFRGVKTGDPPFEILGTDTLASASATVTIPGGTTSGDNRLVIAVASLSTDGLNGAQMSSEANADLANLTEIIDNFGSGGGGGGLAVYAGEKASAGSVGATTATAAATGAQERLCIALIPPPA